MRTSYDGYFEAVQQAIEHAPVIDATQASIVPSNGSPLFELPDDTIVDYNFPAAVPKPVPFEVIADDMDSLPLLGRAAWTALKRHNDGVPEERILQDIMHENEHNELSMYLGARAATGGIRFARVQSADGEKLGYQAFHRPFELTTTKLGIALMTAYPRRPSLGDIQYLDGIGYPTITGLVRKIVAHNEQPGARQLPLPLSRR